MRSCLLVTWKSPIWKILLGEESDTFWRIMIIIVFCFQIIKLKYDQIKGRPDRGAEIWHQGKQFSVYFFNIFWGVGSFNSNLKLLTIPPGVWYPTDVPDRNYPPLEKFLKMLLVINFVLSLWIRVMKVINLFKKIFSRSGGNFSYFPSFRPV